jgi:hypothetical protein
MELRVIKDVRPAGRGPSGPGDGALGGSEGTRRPYYPSGSTATSGPVPDGSPSPLMAGGRPATRRLLDGGQILSPSGESHPWVPGEVGQVLNRTRTEAAPGAGLPDSKADVVEPDPLGEVPPVKEFGVTGPEPGE